METDNTTGRCAQGYIGQDSGLQPRNQPRAQAWDLTCIHGKREKTQLTRFKTRSLGDNEFLPPELLKHRQDGWLVDYTVEGIQEDFAELDWMVLKDLPTLNSIFL